MPLYKLPNIASFIVFRVFFNARFYYPVFALLFLDFGLTLSQFSLSNLVWAAAIVVLEVPSGALADVLGRKKLVVAAAVLMIIEMLVLLVAEAEPSLVLLGLFCLNRLLSGAAEAMASGADEALAYDSLQEAGRESEWPRVLEWQTRFSSLAFFVAMLVGAAVYDPELMTRAAAALGWPVEFSKQDTLKLPIWLTLGSALVALAAALSMRPLAQETQEEGGAGWGESFARVRAVGSSLLVRHSLAAIILAAVLFDQAARLPMTLSSQTLASFGFEERWFGVIGAGFALMGAAVAGPARYLAEHRSPTFIFWTLALLTLTGLLGQALTSGWAGLLFLACLSAVMSLVGFFSSHFINRITASKERATTLSFRGLANNVAFGVISLYYAAVTGVGLGSYGQTLLSIPVYFLFCLVLFLLYRWRHRAPELEDSGEAILR